MVCQTPLPATPGVSAHGQPRQSKHVHHLSSKSSTQSATEKLCSARLERESRATGSFAANSGDISVWALSPTVWKDTSEERKRLAPIVEHRPSGWKNTSTQRQRLAPTVMIFPSWRSYGLENTSPQRKHLASTVMTLPSVRS